MNGGTNHGRNARVLKGLSLLCIGLLAVSLVFVHGDSYRPAVSYVLLYLTVSVIFTAAAALLLLPARQFGEGFCAAFYVLYAASLAGTVFFTGGVSSDLYGLFFSLILASALHGSWGIWVTAQAAVLVSYSLAVLPDALEGVASADGPAPGFFRLAVFAFTGLFALFVAGRGVAAGGEEGYVLDEDGSVLLERVSTGIGARRGGPVGVILVDVGREVEELELLMRRVRAKVGDPVLLGGGAVFGVVLGGADDRVAKDAARQALAAAVSSGAEGARAGAAIYPRDARSAEDLLAAAGKALEAAFDLKDPGAIVLAGRDLPETPFRAAR